MKPWISGFLGLYIAPDAILGVVKGDDQTQALEVFYSELNDAIKRYREQYRDEYAQTPFELNNRDDNNWGISILPNEWIIGLTLKFNEDSPSEPEQRGKAIIDFIDYVRVEGLIGSESTDPESGTLAISPNWVGSVADPVNIPTGGPGSSMNKNVKNGAHTFEFEPILSRATPLAFKEKSEVKEVAVVIMDTPLCRKGVSTNALADDHAESLYNQVTMALPNAHITPNPLLPKSKLTTVGNASKPKWDDVKFHSLFIAGIIKSIAPAVELYLVETLNPQGFGSLASFIWSLNTIKDLASTTLRDKRMIVNFSGLFPWPPELILALLESEFLLCEAQEKTLIENLLEVSDLPPTIQQLLKDRLVEIQNKRGRGYNGDDPDGCETETWKELFEFLAYATKMHELIGINKLFDRDDLGVPSGSRRHTGNKPILIAAAGNESAWQMKQTGIRFGATYPATLTTVVGIGALRQKLSHEKADYSNEADHPSSHGFWVFGGDTQAPANSLDIPSPVNGVIGLCSDSPNGWAEWSGTSFATAIFSGILAAMCSTGTTQPLQQLIIGNKFKKIILVNQS